LTSRASEIAKRWPSRSSTFSIAKPSQGLRVTRGRFTRRRALERPAIRRLRNSSGLFSLDTMGAPVGRDRGGPGSRNGLQLIGGAKHARRCRRRFGRKPGNHQLHRQYDDRRAHARFVPGAYLRPRRFGANKSPRVTSNLSPGWWKFETMVSGALVRDRGRHLASASSTSTTTGDF
jgi:hypothetical protein